MQKIPFFLILCTFLMLSCSENGEAPGSSSSESETIPVEDYNAPVPPSEQDSGPDPLFSDAWHLINTGQKSFAEEGGNVGEDVGLGNLHRQESWGEGIRLAISDNGVELAHPELWPNRLEGMSRNYMSSTPSEWHGKDPNPLGERSIHSHGTAVTGLAVADGQNGIGTRGLAPSAKFAGFLYVGVANSNDKMLDQAHGDFDIFNYSYGRVSCRFSSVPESYIDQLRFGVNELRNGLGALYIKAAGNEFVGLRDECVDGSESLYAGNAALEREHSSPFMIVVGANNARGRSSSYSTPGSALWMSAPGGEFGDLDPAMISTDLMGCERGRSQSSQEINSFESGDHPENSNCDYTSTMNGTSSSTPLVSAAVALILEANPSLSWREVKYILAQSARRIDPFIGPTRHPFAPDLDGHIYQRGWQKNKAGFHFHNWYGFGALDVYAAVELARDYTGELPKLEQTLKADGSWKYDSGDLDLSIPDASADGVEHEILVQDDLRIEAVQIRLTVDHSFASDVGVELTSPSSTVSQLMTINSGIAEKKLQDVILLSNAFLGESSQGQWKLKVIDGAEEDFGTLKNWKINVWGHEASSSSSSSSGSGLNLFSGSSDSSNGDKTDLKVATLDYNQGSAALKSAQRSPGLPSSADSRAPSDVKTQKNNLVRKVVNSTQDVSYEWKTYEAHEKVDSDSKNLRLLDFFFDDKTNSRLDIYESIKEEKSPRLKMVQSSLSSQEIIWEVSLPLPQNQNYAGAVWSKKQNEIFVATRAPQGEAFIWAIEKGELPIQPKMIETKLLSERTNAALFESSLFVWDDYFLHQWDWRDESEEKIHQIISFKGQEIQSVFEDSKRVFVWTSSQKQMSLWKVQEGKAHLVQKRDVEKGEQRYLPLTQSSLLVRHDDQSVWLSISREEKPLQAQLSSFPFLLSATHVHVEDHPEGELVVLWAYEKGAEVFHQFQFYLAGGVDE